jgi:thioredoxin 1
MAGLNVREFTDANFESEVIKSDQAVLVDFWAEWCGPCKALGPTIDALATRFAGKAKIGKVDVDANMKTAGSFQILAIPTVMIFRKGKIVKRFQGPASEAVLAGAIEAAMNEA